jgi:hypothetical protein
LSSFRLFVVAVEVVVIVATGSSGGLIEGAAGGVGAAGTAIVQLLAVFSVPRWIER